ncbi:MFS transporter [Enterobacteriaceae bacterium LUAb1]
MKWLFLLKGRFVNQKQVLYICFCSFILTVGRGISLPFLPVYLHNILSVSTLDTGLVLTVSMIIGMLSGTLVGKVARLIPSRILMLGIIAVFSLSFLVLSISSNIISFIIFFASVTCSYSFYSSLIKGTISDYFPVHEKSEVFSLNYIAVNAGWVVGPLLGVYLSGLNYSVLFLSSSLCGLLVFGLVKFIFIERQKLNLHDVVLKSTQGENINRNFLILLLFTIGAFFCSLVYGRFVSCIAQILMVDIGKIKTEGIIAVITTTNAVSVLSFQYILSKGIRESNLSQATSISVFFLLIGILGFSLSGANVIYWCFSTILFTVGEIILAPVQYLLIDKIAPDDKKVSYFSIQELSNIGGAINPLLTGFIIAFSSTGYVYFILGGCCCLAGLIFHMSIIFSQRYKN